MASHGDLREAPFADRGPPAITEVDKKLSIGSDVFGATSMRWARLGSPRKPSTRRRARPGDRH
jgi:hypothetical protein